MRLQKYTIRDLTTGQLFVVDAEPDAAIEALAAAPPGSPKAAATTGLVTEISSGREMSLQQFDRALGLHTALEVSPLSCLLRLWQLPAAAGPGEGLAAARIMLGICLHDVVLHAG